MPTILTVGHSHQSSDEFVALLLSHRVEQVVDVRSIPYSKHVPHFNRESLKARLARRGIDYVYLGEQLGGHPDSDELYVNGRVVYERVAKLRGFRRGIDRVVDESELRCVAVMCSEEDPAQCHRHTLLALALQERGLRVQHVRRDGSIQDATALTDPTDLQMPLLEPEGEDLTWHSPKRIRRRADS